MAYLFEYLFHTFHKFLLIISKHELQKTKKAKSIKND
jgi:hypothetical protein